jgi:hypothetical protein
MFVALLAEMVGTFMETLIELNSVNFFCWFRYHVRSLGQKCEFCGGIELRFKNRHSIETCFGDPCGFMNNSYDCVGKTLSTEIRMN